MKRKKVSKCCGLLLLALLIFPFSVNSQNGFLHRQGKVIVNGNGEAIKLRGVNLGGWLQLEGWIWGAGYISETTILNRIAEIAGKTETDNFHDKTDQNFIEKKDIGAISQSCFNVIRLVFNHRLLEDDSLPNVYKQSGWNVLDSVISWCEQYSVYVVLDMHAAPGGQSSLFIADPDSGNGDLLWDKESNKARTIALWKAIAQRYKDKNIIAGYDLLNEPSPPLLLGKYYLNDLYTRIIQAIRTADPNHMVILEGTSSATDFSIFKSLPDSNVCLSFHIYTWLGEDPKAGISKYKGKIDSLNVPMWCGEWGENNYRLLDSTKKALDDMSNELSGWSFWTWKKVMIGGYPYFQGIRPSAMWTKLINHVANPVLSPAPSSSEAMQGMNEFQDAIKYENTIVNDTLRSLLKECGTQTAMPHTSHQTLSDKYMQQCSLEIQGNYRKQN